MSRFKRPIDIDTAASEGWRDDIAINRERFGGGTGFEFYFDEKLTRKIKASEVDGTFFLPLPTIPLLPIFKGAKFSRRIWVAYDRDELETLP